MLRTVLIQLSNVHLDDRKIQANIEGFANLLGEFGKHDVKVVSLDLEQKLILNNINKKECLVICDLESTVKACHSEGIPCIAYENVKIPRKDLFQADMLVQGFDEVDYQFVLNVYNRFHQIPIEIASTDRILIREMVLEDLDELYELYSDDSIIRFIEPLYEKEEEIEFTKAYIKNMYGFYGYGLWSLIEKSTGRLVGRAGLNNREVDGEIQIELGYMIGVPFQRQGYAYEVCKEILKFAVKQLECSFVNSFVHPKNNASIALLNKLGFCYIQEVEIDKEKLSWYRWTYEE